jgi:hypothetical protein
MTSERQTLNSAAIAQPITLSDRFNRKMSEFEISNNLYSQNSRLKAATLSTAKQLKMRSIERKVPTRVRIGSFLSELIACLTCGMSSLTGRNSARSRMCEFNGHVPSLKDEEAHPYCRECRQRVPNVTSMRLTMTQLLQSLSKYWVDDSFQRFTD